MFPDYLWCVFNMLCNISYQDRKKLMINVLLVLLVMADMSENNCPSKSVTQSIGAAHSLAASHDQATASTVRSIALSLSLMCVCANWAKSGSCVKAVAMLYLHITTDQELLQSMAVWQLWEDEHRAWSHCQLEESMVSPRPMGQHGTERWPEGSQLCCHRRYFTVSLF